MKNYGFASIDEFLGDFVVYRNLTPLDQRLPTVDDLRKEADVPPGVTPRKSEPVYARVIVRILQAAKALDAADAAIERLVYVGDTRLNDGNAFINIARAGEWPGMAFIAAEKDDPTPPEIVKQHGGNLYLASRWNAIADFELYCHRQNFPIDAHTAVIVDIDKTAMGGRGRNDHLINQARVVAVRRTVEDLLGADFNAADFQAAYAQLNQAEFHPFTTDNQDYLAYICLVLGSGLVKLSSLITQVRSGKLSTFEQFITAVDARAGELPVSLKGIHARVHERVENGDPTPFKSFRYNEYRATVERMGCLGEDADVEALLANEIVMTEEVRAAALRWKERGALLFGLSDKPDEASVPTPELAEQGYEPIHRVETHAVGF